MAQNSLNFKTFLIWSEYEWFHLEPPKFQNTVGDKLVQLYRICRDKGSMFVLSIKMFNKNTKLFLS